ncbi:hypothetical protein Tco_0156483 [Tanacetum coccineum]
MPYPRFTKVIINHFISKDKTISMRNMIELHTIRDDSLFDTLKFVSKTQDYQQYGALIPNDMINQDIKYSKAYKTYYDFATGKVPPRKARKYKKVVSPSRKLSPVKEAEYDKKDKRFKRPTKKSTTAPTAGVVIRDTPGVSVSNKKAPAKADRSKGIEILSDVALSKAAQLKEATKKSKKVFHISQASGSGDGTDFESGVPNEQQRKTSGTDEGTGTKPGVPDVPVYQSESDDESWGDSEDDNDDLSDDDDDDNDDNNNDNRQEESSTQAPSLFTVLEMAILETSTAHATTFPPTISMITPLPQLTTPSPAPTTVPTTTSIPENLAFVLSDFATPVIHSTINESLENVILAKSSSQPKSTYEAAESLTEFELKKILLDKMKRSESYKTAPEHKELYEGLVKSYNLDKDLFSSYGNVYSLNRDHDDKDKDKDEDPFTGSDRGLKKRKTSKNAEPPKGSKSKESKTSSSKGTKSQPKSSGKSVQAEEPVFETADTEMPQDQGGDTEDQSNVETTPMDDWFKKPNKPLNPDRAWNDGKSIDSRPPQKWISNIAKQDNLLARSTSL